MVTICQISQVDYGLYDEVWAIVRSLKYGNPHLKHVPELSPSWTLFKMYMRMKENGTWNKDIFMKRYVPQFLKEMRGNTQKNLLNLLYNTKKHICLVCFCPEEELCHRSIIGGMLQGVGLDVKGLSCDYSYYFDWWKNGVPGDPEGAVPPDEPVNVTAYNTNVTYLYKTGCDHDKITSGRTMCFTGRRPKDLCGYDTGKYKTFVMKLSDLIYEEFYQKHNIRHFITGGAQGFDQMAFWAVERMKKAYSIKDAENIVVIPFEGQEIRWAKTGCFSQTEYELMLKRADRIIVACKDNVISSMFVRNHTMCDASDYCLALYPDDEWKTSGGGTAECMKYAKNSNAKLLQLKYTIDKYGLCIGDMEQV